MLGKVQATVGIWRVLTMPNLSAQLGISACALVVASLEQVHHDSAMDAQVT